MIESNSSDPAGGRKSQRAGTAAIGAAKAREHILPESQPLGIKRLEQGVTPELPARAWREEVAVGRTAVPARGCAACAFQHQLTRHELAVIFADGSLFRCKARVGFKGALGPFPHIAEDSAFRPGEDRTGSINDRAVSSSSGSAEWLKSSHSASVGIRASAQRAKASAS